MFIAGGLLMFGLLTMLSAILLAKSEVQAATAQHIPVLSKTVVQPVTMENTQRTNLPVPVTKTSPALNEHEQAHELALEVSSIQQQAQDFRQRLSILIDHVEHLKRKQIGHVTVVEV